MFSVAVIGLLKPTSTYKGKFMGIVKLFTSTPKGNQETVGRVLESGIVHLFAPRENRSFINLFLCVCPCD